MNFVISMAKLFSVSYQIPGESKINSDFVVDALRDVDVPEFVPKNKVSFNFSCNLFLTRISL